MSDDVNRSEDVIVSGNMNDDAIGPEKFPADIVHNHLPSFVDLRSQSSEGVYSACSFSNELADNSTSSKDEAHTLGPILQADDVFEYRDLNLTLAYDRKSSLARHF
eukprot:Awhi_evm1s13446